MDIIPYDGKQITVNGIYSGVPMSLYHDLRLLFANDRPAISSSGLRKIVKLSSAHFWATYCYNPRHDPEDREETAALALGRAAHLLLCRQPDFDRQFIERPEKYPDYRTKAAREWRDEQHAAGKTILTALQIKTIRGMVTTLGKSALFLAGILDGYIELSLFWFDPQTRVWLKARPDVVPNDSGDYVDLKTTLLAHYPVLQASIAEYGYDQQAALIMFTAQQLGLPVESFSFLFLEKSAPYCAATVELKGEDILLGDQLNRRALQIFAANWENFRRDPEYQWPGPGDDIRHIELPDWAKKQRLKWLEINKEAA